MNRKTTINSPQAESRARYTTLIRFTKPNVGQGRSGYIRTVLAALLVIFSLLGVTFEANSIRKFFSGPNNFAVVEPGAIYRSGQIQDYWVRDVLEKHHIDRIVNLGEDKPKPDQIAERAAASDLKIERHTYFLSGNGTGPTESYVSAVRDIDAARRANQSILVHCSAGAQRTSGAIALYQLLVEQKPIDEVRKHALDFHCPIDNPKLFPYLNENVGEIARRLVEEGVIKRVPDSIGKF